LINLKEEKLLLGKRKDSGLYGLPGGWLENGEEWEECARRELWEETGLSKQAYMFSHVYTLNCIMTEVHYHNISCIMLTEVESFELEKIKNMEPQKCSGWIWVTVKDLRLHLDKLFYPLKYFLEKFKNINNVSDLKALIKRFEIKRSCS
jgi:8-oxo-dGTP diphosphatase